MRTIRINTFFPTRNKFIYADWVELRNCGGHEGVVGVFDIVLVFKAFLLEEVVQMLKEVIAGRREVRRVSWVVENFIVQLMPRYH